MYGVKCIRNFVILAVTKNEKSSPDRDSNLNPRGNNTSGSIANVVKAVYYVPLAGFFILSWVFSLARLSLLHSIVLGSFILYCTQSSYSLLTLRNQTLFPPPKLIYILHSQYCAIKATRNLKHEIDFVSSNFAYTPPWFTMHGPSRGA